MSKITVLFEEWELGHWIHRRCWQHFVKTFGMESHEPLPDLSSAPPPKQCEMQDKWHNVGSTYKSDTRRKSLTAPDGVANIITRGDVIRARRNLNIVPIVQLLSRQTHKQFNHYFNTHHFHWNNHERPTFIWTMGHKCERKFCTKRVPQHRPTRSMIQFIFRRASEYNSVFYFISYLYF